MTSLEKQLRGWRLTTAEIFYRLPDHPRLLQSYVWQDLDRSPDFPILKRFLDFWDRHLDGKLHSVTVGSVGIVKPAELRMAIMVGTLH